ncbi:sensor histidine kinase [Zobellia laminariae]|uniref:sensor histidine kinase n=1 Tax=Zobellia laminariae TaxID=248906 RepID=UPI003EF49D0A
MRLIRKTSQTFLWISAVLMVVSTVALYFYVKNLLREEVEEELFSTMSRVEIALATNKMEFSLAPLVDVSEVTTIEAQILKDTIIYDPSQKEMEEFRELTAYKEINQKKYRISVRNLVIESEDILAAIVISYLIIIVSVFLILFYFNKARNKKLWMPFFKNLEAMKSFSLASNKPIPLVDSEILEFSELNTEIGILTDKVRGDYKNLKQFTEDVSHELQNPLAIIQAKIENIINGDTLNDNQFEHLTSIQKDIQRLAQMNKRLTILTKIENNQFAKLEKVTITDLIQETITNFLEISSSEIEFSKDQIIEVQMDRYLAEILCNNLMSNAIKHSPKEGKIVVVAKGNSLFVSNEGSTALENPEKLYSRFYRESDTNKSTGLGLAIVKRICDLYRFSIAYNFDENKHIFTINFN